MATRDLRRHCGTLAHANPTRLPIRSVAQPVPLSLRDTSRENVWLTHETSMFQPIEQLTARGWRCVAYDHRGSGESPVDPAFISVEEMVDDVAGVLDALQVERCILAGESLGGAIAQYAAVRNPQRFDGLVLPAPARTGRSEGSRAFADACRSDYRAAVDEFVRACFPEPDSDHVKRWGRNILFRAEPEQAARLLPDAEIVEFEGSGHVPTMTRPNEVVDAILRRFP